MCVKMLEVQYFIRNALFSAYIQNCIHTHFPLYMVMGQYTCCKFVDREGSINENYMTYGNCVIRINISITKWHKCKSNLIHIIRNNIKT